jgi:hypothetical protein
VYVNLIVNVIGNHAVDVHVLGGNIHTIKKNTEALVVASKGIGVEVNAGTTK